MNYRNNMRSRGYQTPMQARRCDYVQTPYTVPDKCGKVNVPDDVISLAMVYTVSQCWKNITDGSIGLDRGTIFDELNKPFKGYECKKGGCAR